MDDPMTRNSRIAGFPVALMAALLLSSCTSNGTGQPAESNQADEVQTVDQTARTGNPETDTSQQDQGLEPSQEVLASSRTASQSLELEELNRQIELASFSRKNDDSQKLWSRNDYRVGPGDILDITVFQVDELNRKVRVSGDGFIVLPLIGSVQVDGWTTGQIENELRKVLGETYINDPQVTVFIDEFRSQQVAVLGAVESPNIYSIQQPRTILELVSLAGGLTDRSGSKIHVRRKIRSESGGVPENELLIVELSSLLTAADGTSELYLEGGDSIVVPPSGTFFVEGAVADPGAFNIKGEVTVLKALSMAGGIVFDTSKSRIQVHRQPHSEEAQVFDIDYDRIREDTSQDITLIAGDIVIVHHSSLKRGLANLWKGVIGIFRYSL